MSPTIADVDAATGILRTIDVGAITASEHKQYGENSTHMSVIRARYGYANYISVTNMCLTVNLMLKLDGNPDREVFIPGGSIVSLDNVAFRSFDLVNATTNTSAGGEVYIVVGYQPFPMHKITGLK